MQRETTAPSSRKPLQETDSSSEVEATVDLRRRLRDEARKQRLRQRLIMFGVVMAPVAIVTVYLLFLVSPQYLAESSFSVQATQASSGPASANSAMTSLLSAGSAANAATGFVDGWLVQDFLNSRDCMRELDKKIGLRRYLTKTNLDPVNYLSPNANEDQLFQAYQRVVHNSFNMIESVNTLDVAGFSPSDSTAISDGLLAVTQDFVNRMDQQGIDDALKVSRRTVETAEAQDKDALAAISSWRIHHADIDPAANATMLLNQIGLEEASLSAAQLSLEKIKAMNNPDHPMLKPAEMQVDELQGRVNQLRAQMSGAGNTSAAELKTYIELTNAQTFADANLLNARQNYQGALSNALSLQRYLSIVAKPVAEVRPSQPNPYLLLFLAFAVGCALAGALNLTLSLYRSFRHA
jgi:capsular polysaccharide transport system permease protein